MKPESEKPVPSTTKSITADQEYDEFCKCTNVEPYLQAMLLDMSDLLPDNIYSESARRRDAATISRRLRCEGLRFATSTLPILAQGLLEHLESGRGRFPSFKLKKGTGHPAFLSGLFSLAYDELSAHHDTAIMLIYQFSVSFKKLKGPYPESVLSKQLRDFVLVNEMNASVDLFNDANFMILERARQLIKSLFHNFDATQAIPRPGPGATNQPVAKHLRYRPHVLYTKIDNVLPYVDFFNVNGYDVVHQTKRYLDLYKNRQVEPRARFKFVFKQFLKARGICIEENESQFLQQAFKNAMYDWIERHPLTKGLINFTDQTINALLALRSSADKEYSTLDESDASNRVPKDLVAWLYQDTDLYEPLMALSTSWIDLPDKVDGVKTVRTHMYAPMGSGLCFPVMSTVHWALCSAILSYSQGCDAASKEVYVYGDDIILRTEGYQAILDWLPRFGMKINENKSFSRSYFRESCGIHAYKGKDITPVYFKYVPSKSIDSAMSCIAIEKQFSDKGFTHVAQCLRDQVKVFHGNIPFVNVNSPVFGFKRDDCVLPSNFNELRRKYDQYGNVLFRARLVKSCQQKDKPPSEEECYLRNVLTKAHSRFIGGEPHDQKTVWSYVSYPQLAGIQPPQWLKSLIPNEGDLNETNPHQQEKSGFRHLHDHLCPFDLYIGKYQWFQAGASQNNEMSFRKAHVRRHPVDHGWQIVHYKDGSGIRTEYGYCIECDRYKNRTCLRSGYGPDLPHSDKQLPTRVPFRRSLDRKRS